MSEYDPFVRGPWAVDVRTVEARDAARDRLFPCEIWRPEAAEGNRPLVIFSHSSGANRRSATFLCTHLSSHGYIVAALDHSETVIPELRRREGESADQKAARLDAVIGNRVPDVRFLLDYLAGDASVDVDRIGIVGHSFGGWTALAAPDVEPRIRAIVALAPGGASKRRPGIIPGTLSFAWGRDIPTLLLVAENDTSLPLEGMVELLERTPATKQMMILRRADHLHFMDNVEEMHESVRNMVWPPELAWLANEMRPIAELCSGEEAHRFIRGLTLAHMDAALRGSDQARRFLAADLESELAARGVDAVAHER